MTTTEQLERLVQVQQQAALRAASYDDPDVAAFVFELAVMGELTAIGNQSLTRGYAYPSYHHMVLELGEVTRAPLFVPDDLGVWPERECYTNAQTLATAHPELTYVEGYALASTMPVNHAWLIDPLGTIIDPTWANLDIDLEFAPPIYCGIRFDTTFMMTNSLRTGWTSIIAGDWRDTYHLERGFRTDETGLVIGSGPTPAERSNS